MYAYDFELFRSRFLGPPGVPWDYPVLSQDVQDEMLYVTAVVCSKFECSFFQLQKRGNRNFLEGPQDH